MSSKLRTSAGGNLAQSKDLAEKSIHAAVAAIEIYNKPDFHFREEAFALLMTNAWELLLKAKWLLDHGEKLASLYEYDRNSDGTTTPRVGRSGNPITFGLGFLAIKLYEDKNSGLEKPCLDNLEALIAVRDTSAHFLNKDLYFGRRILEIGTATLQNYIHLAREWFQADLSRYNFFLMPLSFYHGFEMVKPASVSKYPEQMQRLMDYLDSLQKGQGDEPYSDGPQHFALRLETRLARAKDGAMMSFRVTDNPKAPEITLREEDVLKTYSLTYGQLTKAMMRRYEDFLANKKYHDLRRPLESNKKLCLLRSLNPTNPKSARQRFYNPNILVEFDKHYTKRKKDSQS
jgi:hypothetical protein